MSKSKRRQKRGKNGQFQQPQLPLSSIPPGEQQLNTSQEPATWQEAHNINLNHPLEESDIQEPIQACCLPPEWDSQQSDTCPEEPEAEAEGWSDVEFASDPDLEDIDGKLQSRKAFRTLNGFEYQLAGPMDKRGHKRSFYSKDGTSERSIRRKKGKLAKMADEGHLDGASLQEALEKLQQKSDAHKQNKAFQATLPSLFNRKRQRSEAPSPGPQPKRARLMEATTQAPAARQSQASAIEHEPLCERSIGVPNQSMESTLPAIPEEWLSDSDSDSDSDSNSADRRQQKSKIDFNKLVEEAIALLKKERRKVGRNERTVQWLAALRDFYKKIERGRMQASIEVADLVRRGKYFARSLRAHARYFEAHRQIKPSCQGQRIAVGGLLGDEDVRIQVKRFLRKVPAGKVTPDLLMKFLADTVLPSCNLQKLSISVRQARRMLKYLGYHSKKNKKGIYWDGHERIDVVKRRKAYLAELEEVHKLCTHYEGKELTPVPPQLKEDEREHVILYHDECARHANEHPESHWLRDDQQVLYKKDQGRLMMVSDFITEATPTGRLVLDDAQQEEQLTRPECERVPVSSRVLIFPSNKPGGDKYWNMEQMIAQMKSTIKLAEYLLPNKTLVFIFDNSSAHNSMATDALNVRKLNIQPGGKNTPDMHDTIIPLDNPCGRGGHSQSMQFPSNLPRNHPYLRFSGKPKGIAVVLEERGLISILSARKFRTLSGKIVGGECAACKAAKSNKRTGASNTGLEDEGEDEDEEDKENEVLGEEDLTDDEDDGQETDCCLRRLLSTQADFRAEKSLLHRIITEAGHKCIFLPKFHCELNPIEYYWAWVKRYFRERCNGNFATSKKLFAEALDACPADVIRRFFRRADRYASVYRLGATGLLAEYAVKKYKSHRSVTQRDLLEAEEEQRKKIENNKGKNLV